MAKAKIKLESNFRTVVKASNESIALGVREAVDEGQETAATRLDTQAGRRGYDLQGSDVDKQSGLKDGKISYPHFYGRWFEYGTVRIAAMPFIRPGHRKMRKVFIAHMGTDFEKWINRRAGIRRR
jgi:hypothetical protein